MIGIDAEPASRAIVEGHAGIAGDDPRAERIRQAVYEGNRVPVIVGHREIAGIATVLGDERRFVLARVLGVDFTSAHRGVLLGDEPLEGPFDESGIAGSAIPVRESELLRFDQQVHAFRAEWTERPQIVTFEYVELLEQQEAL